MHEQARAATDHVLDRSANMDPDEAKRFLVDVLDVLKANLEDLEQEDEQG